MNSDQKIAVIGLKHKEAFFALYWQNYYGSLFGYDNLYILGDALNDQYMWMFQSAKFLDLNARFQGDHSHHVQAIIDLQTKLLKNYDTVIFAEADEFLIADPDKYKDLKHFLDENHDDYFRCQGYNIIHDLYNEPPINPSIPLLTQRKYWYKNEGESKTLIVRKPVQWYQTGFHNCIPSFSEHPDLYNLHFHEFDLNICHSRVRTRLDTKLPVHIDLSPHPESIFCIESDLHSLKKYHIEKLISRNIELIPEKIQKMKVI